METARSNYPAPPSPDIKSAYNQPLSKPDQKQNHHNQRVRFQEDVEPKLLSVHSQLSLTEIASPTAAASAPSYGNNIFSTFKPIATTPTQKAYEASTNSPNINHALSPFDEGIARKHQELQRQYDIIEQEKGKIQGDIKDLLKKQIEVHQMDADKVKELYEWQQPDLGKDSRFQIIHLLITAIVCLMLGGYLNSGGSSSQTVNL
ncbi:hypothetical protein FGO68_gene422 [Halteria grandinella]|uniref:Uncharacterized protein n=1 Tax=Halteria grandinella TaxID=5974 RepID=A0A8J8SVS4_HALGN|nr:hypothetical protein FGO68_gene422 [Halteria grandinella]